MKKTLLSILFAIMLVAGILGTLLESAMIYDRFTGDRITLEYELKEANRNTNLSYTLTETIINYLENHELDTLKNLCDKHGIKFAIYSSRGTPLGRNMSPNIDFYSEIFIIRRLHCKNLC